MPMLIYVLSPINTFSLPLGFGGCHAEATSWHCIAPRNEKENDVLEHCGIP